MKILFLSRQSHQSANRAFSLSMLGLGLPLLMAVITGGSLWAGYHLGLQAGDQQAEESRANDLLHDLLLSQREELQETRDTTHQHLDALALRLGQLQSRIMRIDALGERLVVHGNLDVKEFNFGEEPARGGADSSGSAQSVELSELVSEMEQLSKTIDNREHKLELMEGLLMDTDIHSELKPSGHPVKKSWISSRYGYRKDPFNGKKVFHHGVDVAGKTDSDVIAVAAGVVTQAEKKSGYGYMVEIHHANGYVTRYGHNRKIFAKVGDIVEKGDVIGLLGSTGRSTGPHVHFEIALNGKSVNPAKYLRSRN